MNVDPRLGAAFLIVFSFAAGWVVNDRLNAPALDAAKTAASAAAAEASAATMAAAARPMPSPPPNMRPASTVEPDSAALETAFTDIYKNGSWAVNDAGVGTSGLGSTLETTELYRAFLAKFMKDAGVKSVVDAGCGDWEFSQKMDWKGIDYKGYDIVKSVVEDDKKKFGKPGIQFFTANIVDDDLPPADLLIVKQVLQHLPNVAIMKFLNQLPKYKHALLMDGVDSRTLSGTNVDIEPGKFRHIDLTKPPYNVLGAKILTYWDGADMQQVVYVANRKKLAADAGAR